MREFVEKSRATHGPTVNPALSRQATGHTGTGAHLGGAISAPRFGNDFSRIPIHSMRGLPGADDENQVIRGRTLGETVGDVARPVGTALGNVFGSLVGLATGITISSATNSGPTHGANGAMTWHVGLTTSGRNGWIVQDIENSWRAVDAAGSAVPSPFTPHYWEAWAVDGTGNVTPSVAGDNDYWDQPDLKAAFGAVEGHWATKGKCYFTTDDPATQGFIAKNPNTNAGDLLSSTSAPANLGIARLHRYAQGTWETTGVHTGSARP